MAVPRSEDWKIGAREMVWRSPELRVEMMKDIQELLATGDDEDRRVAYSIARGLLELEFDTDEELLAQLRESIAA
jgi:hypothetical protein